VRDERREEDNDVERGGGRREVERLDAKFHLNMFMAFRRPKTTISGKF